MADTKMVEVSQSELDELRELRASNDKKKATSKARTGARQELIKRHRTEYDKLIAEFTG